MRNGKLQRLEPPEPGTFAGIKHDAGVQAVEKAIRRHRTMREAAESLSMTPQHMKIVLRTGYSNGRKPRLPKKG